MRVLFSFGRNKTSGFFAPQISTSRKFLSLLLSLGAGDDDHIVK